MTRPEIQALRALAVASVVLYHAWPSALPGGYAGVDVFFAISGFLISSHLFREADRGRVSLPGFWARRARRLLPAALLTLLVVAVATMAFVPQLYWQQFLTENLASGLYVQNWQLAHDAVDYLASEQQPSPVNHFWSLSAEEQFYLVWPLLIGGAAFTATRTGKRRRHVVGATLGAVTAASLVWSIVQTHTDASSAYFVTPTRAWEFGAGGLLALAVAGGRLRISPAKRQVVAWAGLAAIVATCVLYSSATPFPGIAAALPVAGALAVIAAGAPSGRLSPLRFLRARPVQGLGDISYAVYLWHWPLLTLAPFAAGTEGPVLTGAMVALTLPVAWASTRYVEDPVRRGAWITARPPRLTFGAAAAATLVVAAVAVGGRAYVDHQIDQAELASQRLLAAHPACFGAASSDPERRCLNPRLSEKVVPAPIEARTEGNASCSKTHREGLVSACSFGAPEGREKATFALVGDSHATHWRGALDVVARREGWRGLSVTRTSCPFSLAPRKLTARASARCAGWNEELPDWFRRHPEVRTVFVSANTGGAVARTHGKTLMQTEMDGIKRAWASLPPSIEHVVVLRDTPKVRFATLDCIDQAVADGRPPGPACSVPRRTALRPDPAAIVAERTRDAGVVDLTDTLCSARSCSPVIGGALVYKDAHHLTPVFSRTLGDQVLRQLRRIGVAG